MNNNQDKNISQTTAQLESEAAENLEVRYINPDNAVFKETAGGFACLDFMGESYPRINVCRAFPFSDPERYISIRKADEKGREIGIINDLADFPKSQADIIRAQINLRYFTPKIEKIITIKEEYGYSYWDTVTDRGGCRFTVAQGGVVKISDCRVIVSDIDGNRFEIPDIMRLTAKELRMVDLYL